MAKKKEKADEQYVEIDEVKYYLKDFNQEQVNYYNHLNDLVHKENSMAFNLVQVRGGKDYFTELLKNSLLNGSTESD